MFYTEEEDWVNKWLDLLQPEDEFFDRYSEEHGSAHVARVMVHAWITGRRHAPEILPELVGAAFVHDLARDHDGTCYEHGPRAAQTKLPLWKPQLAQIGVQDFAMVEDMVRRHCVRQAPDDSRAVLLFRQADALDRVRLGDLDTRYLFDDSPELVALAEKLLVANTDRLHALIKIVPSKSVQSLSVRR